MWGKVGSNEPRIFIKDGGENQAADTYVQSKSTWSLPAVKFTNKCR